MGHHRVRTLRIRISVSCTTLVVFFAVLAAKPACAQNPEWSFNAKTPSPIPIPAWLPADSLRYALAYYETGDEIRGLVVDLNRDGVTDYILQYSREVCGTNCQYALVDGSTRRSLGLVWGSVLYIGAQFINGYPVISQYGHSSADSGSWSTLVYDGRQYVSVGSLWLDGASLERVFEELKDVPYGAPPHDPR